MNTPRLRSVFSLLCAAFLLVGLAVPALGSSSDEQYLVDAINSARAAAGAPSLSIEGSLVGYARQHAQKMADAEEMFHSSNLGAGLSGWRKLGENVGRGGDMPALHQAFMDSSAHRANLLDSDFDKVGVGVVYSASGVPHVVQVFMDSADSPPPTTAPPPTTTPPTTAAPAPAPTVPPPTTTTTAPPEAQEPDPPAAPRFNEYIVATLLSEDLPQLTSIGDVTEQAQIQAARSAATTPWLI